MAWGAKQVSVEALGALNLPIHVEEPAVRSERHRFGDLRTQGLRAWPSNGESNNFGLLPRIL